MVKRLFILNLLLQCFDGLLSYQAFLVGAVETNPLVAAAICSWGVIYGLQEGFRLCSVATDLHAEAAAPVLSNKSNGCDRFGLDQCCGGFSMAAPKLIGAGSR